MKRAFNHTIYIFLVIYDLSELYYLQKKHPERYYAFCVVFAGKRKWLKV